MSCIYEDCTNKARFTCSCKPMTAKFCETHANLHCLLQGSHKLSSLYMHLDDLTQQKFTKKVQERFQVLSQLIHKINQKSYNLLKTIIKSTESAVSSLKSLQTSYLHQCLSALQNKEVLIDDYRSFLETEDYTPILMFPQESQLESRIEDYFSIDFTLHIKLEPSLQSSDYTKSFVFFEKNSKNMIVFDLLEMQQSSYSINCEDYMGDNAGWCRLPERKVFYYGGQLSTFYPPLSSCYIIDLQNRTLEKKAEAPRKKYTIGVCVCFNNEIFAFGGSGVLGSLYNECEKFSLANNNWTAISDLPFGSDYNSAVVRNGKIYVTGYRIGVIEYRVDSNEYGQGFEMPEGGKVLIEESGNLFLLYSNWIFVCEAEEWVRIRKPSSLAEDVVLVSYPVKKGNFVYFLMSDNWLYKFNLTLLAVERVQTVSGF